MNILPYKATAHKCGDKSKMTIRRWATDPKYAHLNFPKPISLGDNSVGFVEGEIDGWLAARAAERDADEQPADRDGDEEDDEEDDDEEDAERPS